MKDKIILFVLKIAPTLIIISVVCFFLFVLFFIFSGVIQLENKVEQDGGIGHSIGKFINNIKSEIK